MYIYMYIYVYCIHTYWCVYKIYIYMFVCTIYIYIYEHANMHMLLSCIAYSLNVWPVLTIHGEDICTEWWIPIGLRCKQVAKNPPIIIVNPPSPDNANQTLNQYNYRFCNVCIDVAGCLYPICTAAFTLCNHGPVVGWLVGPQHGCAEANTLT